MSSKPYPEGVAQLLLAARSVRELDAEQSRLATVIEQSQKQLEVIRASRYLNAQNITKLLTSMDCASNHNYGWELRIVWLMAELCEQAKAT